MTRHALQSLICIILCTGCLAEQPASLDKAVRITEAAVLPNPYNALSTSVTFQVHNADSARVLYWTPGAIRLTTPFYPVTDGRTTIATLGLRSGTTYYHVVEALAGDRASFSDSLPFITTGLPQILEDVRLEITGTASAGYILVCGVGLPGDTSAVIAFDSIGDIAWYRLFGEGVPSTEAKQQPSGNFTAFLGSTRGWEPTYGRYVEFTPAGEIVRTYRAPTPFYTDNHEILITPQDGNGFTAHLFGYELRTVDLSSRGGPVNALVAGHIILRQTSSGTTEFMWNAWDHFSIDDWIEPGVNPPLDFDHPNSLAFALDGNYVVSFRNMGEITKIDFQTGNIIWRLGGRNNQFTIINDPLGGFSAQHSVRVLDNGNLLIYDNGLRHSSPESRAIEYRLDTATKEATLVWEFRHTPSIFTSIVGSVQRYTNGNTLVGFGLVGTATEVTSSGTTVWEGVFRTSPTSAASFYRATKIVSLYEYQRP